jgi:DNA-binding CsgD family transcriptional regulator
VENAGFSNLSLDSGDHICALYSGSEERNAMLTPYVQGGLAAGDKCVCIVEAEDRAALLAGVREWSDVDIDASLHHRQLELYAAADSYLREGSFSTADMVGFWTRSLGAALDDGSYDAVRHAGDTVAVSDVVEQFDEFALYESELNRLVATHPQTMLCLYDVRRLGGGVLLELLRTHPKLLMDGLVVDNPHYLAPDEYLAARRARAWAELTDGERRLAEDAAEGRSTAEVAELQSQSRHDVDHSLHGIFRKLRVDTRDDLRRYMAERRRPR